MGKSLTAKNLSIFTQNWNALTVKILNIKSYSDL
jgi:hypothetical protein